MLENELDEVINPPNEENSVLQPEVDCEKFAFQHPDYDASKAHACGTSKKKKLLIRKKENVYVQWKKRKTKSGGGRTYIGTAVKGSMGESKIFKTEEKIQKKASYVFRKRRGLLTLFIGSLELPFF